MPKPHYKGGFLFGGINPAVPIQTIAWEGIHWAAGILLGRLTWVGVAIGLGLLAADFFRRFDPAPARIKRACEAAAPARWSEKSRLSRPGPSP